MMAGRSFTRHSNGIGNRIRAEHINELQSALEEDDARIDLKADEGQFAAHTANMNNPHGVTKDQLGLGNVDNTSDMAKPVSTAVQAALDTKAAKADAVPEGGVYGQVLTVTHSGREWVDPPGIVYPSLLLSPDGSFDRSGPVSPTIGSAVSVIDGQYGKAWQFGAQNGNVTLPIGDYLATDRGTVIARVRPKPGGSYPIDINAYQGMFLGNNSNNMTMLFVWGDPVEWQSWTWSTISPLDTWAVWVITWDESRIRVYVNGTLRVNDLKTSAANFGTHVRFGERPGVTRTSDGESALYYREPLPHTEIERIAGMTTRWTMDNTRVNLALANQPPAGSPFLQMHPPNRKIATGGATLRTAPGPSTQAITTLAAGTDVHDTKQTVSVSSVSYSLVVTAFGNAWVPSSTLV